MISQKVIFRLVAWTCNFSSVFHIIIPHITFRLIYIVLELHSFTIQQFVGFMKIRLHAPEPMVGNECKKQLRDLSAWDRATWAASTGRGLLYLLFSSNRDTEAARTIETSVITLHKRQYSTLNIYLRPNPNLQFIRCLCLAVSLYSALQAVVPEYRKSYKPWLLLSVFLKYFFEKTCQHYDKNNKSNKERDKFGI